MSSNEHIRLLPQPVIDKIAAGEVIERPASVLKELIENSIDCGATRIQIVVEDSGFSLIQITDNGCGMSKPDLQLSILRHATSKIQSADDLFSVTTMGFRGEALSSIGAVSRMTITTCDNENGIGWALIIPENSVAPAPHGRGTTVTVRDLFYNVPARKKFMKSRLSERMALLRIVEQIAIPFPAIHFTAIFEGKPVFDAAAVDNEMQRIAQVAGPEYAKKLVVCTHQTEGLGCRIYVSTPQDSSTRPRYQNTYVNLRRIDNDSVTYSIREAFSQFIHGHIKPAFFCFIDVDPAKIDVNVHPAKQKLKFDNERAIFRFIYHAIRSTMGENIVAFPARTEPNVEEQMGEYRADAPADYTDHSESDLFANHRSSEHLVDEHTDSEQTVLQLNTQTAQKNIAPDDHTKLQLSHKPAVESWNLIPCFQIHGIFVMVPIKDGVMLIDQHAAHERVLYEQAIRDIAAGRGESQQLLFPVVVELSQTEKSIVQGGVDFLRCFGFEVSEFGGNAVMISAIPAFMKAALVEEAVRAMIAYLIEEIETPQVLETEKRFAAAFACGAAIKAGQKLTPEEMNALLNTLFVSENPYTCPHGRPTVIRISLDELRRRFLR